MAQPAAAAAAVVAAAVAAVLAAVAAVLAAAQETGWGLLAPARVPVQEQRGVLIRLQGRTRQAVEAALMVVVLAMEGAARMQGTREGGAVGVTPWCWMEKMTCWWWRRRLGMRLPA